MASALRGREGVLGWLQGCQAEAQCVCWSPVHVLEARAGHQDSVYARFLSVVAAV